MKVGDLVRHQGQHRDRALGPLGRGLIIERGRILTLHAVDYTYYEVLWSKVGEVREQCGYELRVTHEGG